jgi:hypothetical protein
MPQVPANALRPFVTLEIERTVVARLRREAARRDLPVKALVRDLLEVIAEDQLVNAVLDDAPPKVSITRWRPPSGL